jgi:hypothetical protein
MERLMRTSFFLFALSCTSAGAVFAQVLGPSVEGTVTDTAGRALDGVQISVVGTNLVTRTDSSGFYRLDAVPGGSAMVRTSILGYLSVQQSVVLSLGDTAILNFRVLALPLTAGGTRVITVPLEQSDSR